MADSQWRNFALVVRRALRMPVSLSILAAGFLLAIVLRDGPGLLALAGAGAGVVVYILAKVRDEAFIRTAIREAQGQRHSAAARSRTFRIEELDVDSRVKMKAIVKLQNEIAEDVANSPVDEVAAGLSDTVEQTEGLVDHALEMSGKRRELLKFLHRTDVAAIEARIGSLEAKLAAETDSVRRAEQETSLAAKRQELEDFRAIDLAAARVLDQLDSIECALSGLRARLVRIKSTDIAEWTAANDELRTELGGLNTAVDTVERTIEEVLSINGPG